MISISSKWLLVMAAVFLAVARTASGGAIELPMQSSKAAAEADAFTAQADDPSAIFYNPAGLTQLHGLQVSAGAYYLQPVFHFHGDNGGNERMDLPTVIPHLYAESDLGTDRFRVGLGINDLYGINEDWGRSGPLSTVVNRAKLEVINIAPTAALRVTDQFSVGVAFNVYYGNLDLERNLIIAAPPAPEADFRLRGHDWAVGVTPGFMYKFDERNQVGIYYKSPFSLDFAGRAQVTSRLIPEIGPSRAHETLHFPQSIGAGYCMKPCDRLKVETDLIWTDWQTVDELRIISSDPHFNGQTLPAHWESGFTVRLGGQYEVARNLFLRAGYAYGQNSVPESTFSPIVPDSNYHLVAAGVGYDTDRWALDLAINAIFRERRRIHDSAFSPVVDGTWSNQFYGVMLTYTLKL